MLDSQGKTIILAQEIPAIDLMLHDLRSSVSALYDLSMTPDGLEQIMPDIGIVSESALALNLIFGRLKQAEISRLVVALSAAE